LRAGERPDSKLLGIELLRFLSSIAVLVFHYQHFKFVGGTQVDFVASQQPFYGFLSLFYQYGFYGVEVFWCISGFIFFWKYGEQIANAKITGSVFFVLRLSRLYPLHFVTLIFMAALQYVYFSQEGAYFVYPYNDVYHFVLQLGFASNWGFQAGDSFNGPIWSISIEVLVYALFFLSLRFISSRAIFIGMVALAAAAIQLLKISEHPVFPCIMYFYVGCLTAIVYRRAHDPGAVKIAVTAGAAILVLGLVILQHYVQIKAKTFLVLFAPALIYLAVVYVPETRWTNRLLVPAGNMTYASYLLHVPIQIAVVVFCNYAGLHVPFYSAVFFLSFLVLTLLLSHVTYDFFEMPAQKLMRRTLMARGRTAAAPARVTEK
jgi:peptidoglycan/LPS O-acetylase OafA/YrhL